jgi:hypothetical protein
MGKTYQRQNGESMASFRARCAAAEAAKKPPAPPIRRRRRPAKPDHVETWEDRLDDFGESPDF